MNNTSQIAGPFPKILLIVIILLLGIGLAYLAWTAYHLEIDYSDAYETFLSVRSLANLNNTGYSFKRPLTFSLFLVPMFAAERFSPAFHAVRGCHLMAVSFFICLLVTLYRLFRLDFNRSESLFAVFLFSLCPVMIHMAPFCKEDIPGALFVTLAFYFYRRGRKKKALRNFLLAGFWMAFAMDTRRSVIPLMFMVMGLYEIFTLSIKRDFVLKVLALGVLSAALFFLFPMVVYPLIGRASFFGAPQKLIEEITWHYRIFSVAYEPPVTNYIYMWRLVGIPFLSFALIGVIVGIKNKVPGTLFNALWFFSFFLFFTYFVRHKEMRYLMALLPPFYFFVSRGITFVLSKLQRPFQIAALGLLLLFPVSRAFIEYGRLLDPIYSSKMTQEVSRYAQDLAGDNHSISWVGTMYALNPKQYVFEAADDFFYIYHFYFHVMRFYTKRTVWGLQDAELIPREKGQKEIFVGPQLARFRKNGDVMVINPEPTVYESSNMVKDRMPMIVERIRTAIFKSAGVDVDGAKLFQNDEWPEAKIKTQFINSSFRVAGENLPDGRYELYLELEGISYPLQFSFSKVEGGKFEALKAEVNSDLPVKSLFLLYYDSVREFSA
ncbi:MAG: glycosyltransferase family 39 protein [Candidatus Omnitrophica bacterium]|nr:glycosyltransferase family 39 protein [Candidatus Omnitrophota bacterium]